MGCALCLSCSFVLQMSEWRCFARFCMHMANKYVGIYSAASAAVTSAALRLVSSRCYCLSKLFIGIYRQIIHFGFTRGIMSTCTHAIFRVQGTTRWTVLPSTMQDVSEGKHRSFGICDDTFEEIVRTNKLTSFYFIDSIPIDTLCRQEGS